MNPPLGKLRKVRDRLMEKFGPIWFFAIARRSKSIHSWALLVAAPWANQDDGNAIRSIATMLKKELTDADRSQLGRIIIVGRSDSLLTEFFRRFGGIYEQATVNIGGPVPGDESIIEMTVLYADNPDRRNAVRHTA